MADAELRLKVTADTSSAKTALKEMGSSVSDTQGKVEKAGVGFKGAFGGFLSAGLVQKAGTEIWNFGKDSVKAYQQAEERAVKFNAAMELLPDASASTTKSLQNQATALSKVTTFSGGQTRAAQAQLAMYKLSGEQIEQLTPLVLDYASRTGRSAEEASTIVGKAMLGQGRALKDVGINFKDTGTVAGNFQQVVEGLSTNVGGLAEEMGSTAAGKMQIMQNQVGALKVSLGEQLVPAITFAADALMKLIGFVSQNKDWLAPLITGVLVIIGIFKVWAIVNTLLGTSFGVAFWWVIAIVAAIAAVVAIVIICWQKFEGFRNVVTAVFNALVTAAQAVWNALVTAFNAIIAAAMAVWSGIQTAVNGIKTAFTAVVSAGQAAWNGLVTAFNAIIGAAQAVWSGIQAAFGAVVSFIGGLPGKIGGALSGLASAVLSPFRSAWEAARDAVSNGVSAIMDFVSGIPGKIASALSGLWDAITSPFRKAVDFAKDIWNGFAGFWNGLPSVDLRVPSNAVTNFLKIGGKGFTLSLPKLPMLARGAYVTSPMAAIIGEGGEPEYVLPESMLRAMVNRVAQDVQLELTVHVPPTANPAETGRTVANALRAYFRAGGRLPVPA